VPAGGRQVNLAIYDFGGRLVQELVSQFEAAGTHETVWRGRNRQGRDVATGLYTCRLRCGDRITTMKMTLLR